MCTTFPKLARNISVQSPYFLTLMESSDRFQRMNSAILCSLTGRYDNPIPSLYRLFKNSSPVTSHLAFMTMRSTSPFACGWYAVVGRRMFDGEEAAEGVPQCRYELWSTVTRNGCGDAKALNPPAQEGDCAVSCCNGGEWNCFRPPSGSINHCKNVGEAVGAGERAYYAHV